MQEPALVTEDRQPHRRLPAGFRDYVAIARPDHWSKHVFILPGIGLAWLLRQGPLASHVWTIGVGLLSAALLASANYVLNEWLDARYDAHHPIKSRRPGVLRVLSPWIVLIEYAVLVGLGLTAAAAVSQLTLVTSVLFVVGALAYNVPPIRTKDTAYVDVLSEAINSPIRLTFGWAMIDPTTLPPGSLLLAYWMGGAYLMTIKRFAERRDVVQSNGVEALARYRRAFRGYTDDSLLLASFLYALMAAFFLAVFLVKYRIEYLLALPLFAVLFVVYFWIGLRRESPAQAPERLVKSRALVGTVLLLAVTMALLTWFDIPALENLTRPHFIHVFQD